MTNCQINPILLIGSLNWYLGKSGPNTHKFCELIQENWGYIDRLTQIEILSKVNSLIKLDDLARINRDFKYQLPIGDSFTRSKWEDVVQLDIVPKNGLVVLD